jgi:hypothetical protein
MQCDRELWAALNRFSGWCNEQAKAQGGEPFTFEDGLASGYLLAAMELGRLLAKLDEPA